jgi:hypothetical protein
MLKHTSNSFISSESTQISYLPILLCSHIPKSVEIIPQLRTVLRFIFSKGKGIPEQAWTGPEGSRTLSSYVSQKVAY